VTRHFESAGLTVAANDPYKGGFITTHHGRPADRIHAIQVELRRDLYMNEDAFEPIEPGFSKLRGIIDGLVASLRTLRL
jgi:N-formylglutamate deformylase